MSHWSCSCGWLHRDPHNGMRCECGAVYREPVSAHDMATEAIERQRAKGLAKYGEALDENTKPHDWIRMAIEEAADGLAYLCQLKIRYDAEIKAAYERGRSEATPGGEFLRVRMTSSSDWTDEYLAIEAAYKRGRKDGVAECLRSLGLFDAANAVEQGRDLGPATLPEREGGET